MNTKNNKRRRASVEKIENAFFEELKKKDLYQIKVSDLCKIAGINRSTFYANYIDVYDLADKIRDRLEAEVDSFFVGDEALRLGERDFLNLFQHIKSNQTLYRFYFKLDYDKTKTQKLYDLYQLYDKLGTADEGTVEYHVAFFKNGFNAIVKRWLERGCLETPEQMRDILTREYRGRFEGTLG